MSAALSALVNGYMVPQLNCKRIKSCAFVGNWGSRKVHVGLAPWRGRLRCCIAIGRLS